MCGRGENTGLVPPKERTDFQFLFNICREYLVTVERNRGAHFFPCPHQWDILVNIRDGMFLEYHLKVGIPFLHRNNELHDD